ncbi:WD40-repeat-containing domain protein [Xylaria nigripes]|nr:WD40-repeat-containing domain protein [Xylaria nigripes]
MLMIGFIREFFRQRGPSAPSLCFCFCEDTNINRNNATSVLRSLVWLLLIQQPSLIEHLLLDHKYAGADLFRGRNSFYALSRAFENMLRDQRLSLVYFAIDALDERSEGRDELVGFISKSFALSQKIKRLLSSRLEVDVRVRLRSPENFIELDTQRLVGPVKAYTEHKLTTLKDKDGYNDKVIKDISDKVQERAENTFLWVALTFKVLEKVHGALAVKKSINASNIDYCRLSNVESNAKKNAESAWRLGKFTLDADLYVECRQSGTDFLKDNYTSLLQAADVSQGRIEIVKRSIKAISSMKKNIYNLEYSNQAANLRPPDEDPLAPLRYSCLHWVSHLRSVDGESFRWLVEVSAFLNKGLLRWLESLSLLEKVPEGVLAIKDLLHLVQSQGVDSCLVELLQDAEKFALSNRAIIEGAPLQIYGSALVFSPNASKVKIQYWNERLPFIEMTAGVDDYWGVQWLTIEECKPVNVVAFSPDGKTLASGSSDSTVKAWDVATGARHKTLEGHKHQVKSVAFSPDGKMLASALSPDVKTLASGLLGCSIRFWDLSASVHEETLKEHSNRIHDVIFSPDGKTLASTSRDATVQLWDVATGAHRKALQGYLDTKIVFSSDSKMFASGWVDNIQLYDADTHVCIWHLDRIQLWDVATGILQKKFQCAGTIEAFSLDGKMFASIWGDSIQLCDTETGVHQQTLEKHEYYVKAVAFLPDNKMLVSGLYDRTVQLWSTETGDRLLSKNIGYRPTSLSFASDGRSILTQRQIISFNYPSRPTTSVCPIVDGSSAGTLVQVQLNDQPQGYGLSYNSS